MARKTEPKKVSYGLKTPFVEKTQEPIEANRDPEGIDFAPGGTIWSNLLSNRVYVTSGVTNGSSNWHGIANTRITIANGLAVTSGDGDPNGVVEAPQGSFYLNTAGNGTQNRAWINTDGGTAWTYVVTGA